MSPDIDVPAGKYTGAKRSSYLKSEKAVMIWQ